jgi:hypothetical protein
MANGNLIVEVPLGTTICVIGDIHEHKEQFESILDKFKPSTNRWVVSVGDVYDKGFGPNIGNEITRELIKLNNSNIGFAVKGNHELKLIKKNKNNLSEELKWWAKLPLSITFKFPRGSVLTVLHAGILPSWTVDDLGRNIELCYVRDVDTESGKMIPLVWINEGNVKKLVKQHEGGVNWHELYDGRFGYIIAGHAAQKDGQPKFFNYSANIDVGVYDTGLLCGQVVDEYGKLGETIIVSGPAAKPDI